MVGYLSTSSLLLGWRGTRISNTTVGGYRKLVTVPMTEPAATEPATSEPPTKKQRLDGTEPALAGNAEGATEWKDLTLNINNCVTKDAAGKSFHELAAMSVQILQGLSGLKEEITACLDVHTVQDLADYKFARYADAIATLASTEVEGKRPERSSMNVGLVVS